ncbi:MAG: 6,7-dimethyl-8-ribityllumazine synthase [Alphaproteobacteria bacterium]|jgi:6,7-dimethyl-8-ribityllumazine synthase
MSEFRPSLLLIEGVFYKDIADELMAGAIAAIEEAGATFERITVPGALEIPQALTAVVRAGQTPYGPPTWRFHGAVALGCVIRGETSHYDIVAGESARALMDIAVNYGVPVGNGILTVENREQAIKRASREGGNKGASAVRACLELINVFMERHAYRPR